MNGLERILLPLHITSFYRREPQLVLPNGLWWNSTSSGYLPNLLGGVIEPRTQPTEELVFTALVKELVEE
jgi:hypothetical protein